MNPGVNLLELNKVKGTVTMTIEEFKKLSKLQETGKATEKLFKEKDVIVFVNAKWGSGGGIEKLDHQIRTLEEFLEVYGDKGDK